MENPAQTKSSNQPLGSINPTPSAPTKSSSKKKYFIIGLVILLFLGLVSFFIYWFLVREKPQLSEPVTLTPQTKQVTPSAKKQKPTEFAGLFAYSTLDTGVNIGVFDGRNSTTNQITTDSSLVNDRYDPYHSNPQFLDESTLIYFSSSASLNETKLIKKNVNNLKQEVLFKFDNKSPIHTNLSFDKNTLVYLLMNPSNKVGLFDLKSNTNKFIYTLPSFGGGRGGTFGDEFTVKLSLDEDKILVTNTIYASNTHMWVIDLQGKLIAEIPTSKGAFINVYGGWLNNNEIFYTNTNSQNTYSYNLATKKEKKIGKGWYFTKLSPNGKKLAYSKLNGEFKTGTFGFPYFRADIYIYDIASGKETLVLTDHYFNRWVNNANIIGKRLKKCEGLDCDPNGTYNDIGWLTDKTVIINLDAKKSKETKIPADFSDFYPID